MDGQRFDDLTRSLVRGVSRRRLIGGLGAGLAGAVWGRRATAAACPPDQIRRNGQGCVCRSTGRPPQPDGSCPCPTGQTRCGATCVDTSRSEAHCGGCGIGCDDGNPCTVDRCRSGSCIHTPVRCPTSTDPCLVSLCDPAAGGCITVPAADGTRCSADDACDGAETCQGGVCTPGTAVVCQPSDECHDAGACDPRSGLCSNPSKPDGAGCGANGVCCGASCCEAPANAAPTCAGACDFVCVTGSTRLGDGCCPDANVCGTTCLRVPCNANACLTCRPDDGACASICDPPANATETCEAGRCGFVCDLGFKPCEDACIPTDECCEECGRCQTCEGGACVNLADDTWCAGSSVCCNGVCCGFSDSCCAGVCTPSDEENCGACGNVCPDVENVICFRGVECCQSESGPGAACDDQTHSCCGISVCQAGECCRPEGVFCDYANENPNVCCSGSCNGWTNQCDPGCRHGWKTCGTTTCLECCGAEDCDDGDPCTFDSCGPGCIHWPIACPATGPCLACDPHSDHCFDVPTPGAACAIADPCLTSVCDLETGACSFVLLPDETLCDDTTDLCTEPGVCRSGACIHAPRRECLASDPCVEASCDPATGECVETPLPDSTSCEDGDLCTLGDVCFGGVCVSGSRLDCPALDLCYGVGTCTPATGVCSTPFLPVGEPCPTSPPCTVGTCDGAGTCVPSPAEDGVPCEGGVCFEGACCTPATCTAGQCGSISDGCGGTIECGGCGSLQVCCGGQCRNGLCCDDASCGAGRHCCAIGCLECCDDSHCPAGTHYCDFGTCTPLCQPDSCPAGQRCCPPGSVTQPGTCAACCDNLDCDPGWSCCGAICRAQCE